MIRFAAAFVIATTSAQAQSFMPNTPEAVLSVAQQFGSAYVDATDNEGRPMIGGTIDGVNYGILFYGCEGTVGCDSLQFYATFEPPPDALQFVNTWNYDKRFASAYQRDDGTVVLNYSVNIDYGVSQANAEDSFDIWSLLLGQFTNRINGLPDDGATSK